jgi:hypothetical protein
MRLVWLRGTGATRKRACLYRFALCVCVYVVGTARCAVPAASSGGTSERLIFPIHSAPERRGGSAARCPDHPLFRIR